jgi:hypothetical protein
VATPAWQMYSLVHDVKKLHSCEALVDVQKERLFLADSLLQLGQGKVVLLENKLKLKDSQIDITTKYLEESIVYYKETIKQKNKKIFKIIVVAIIEGALILLLILTDK